MRPTFGSTERLKAKARENLDTGYGRIRRWWCQKYNRPENDARFQSRAYTEWAIEMFEDLYERRNETERAIEERTLSISQGDEILRRIARALGEDEGLASSDPLIDQWERDLEEGRIPDLEA